MIQLLTSAIAFGTVILFGALGEILIERSGHLNLGIPGIMYLGAIGGLIASFMYENGGGASPVAGILLSMAACVVFAGIGGLIYAFLYSKSKTLAVPILVHMIGNSIGMLFMFMAH